MITNWQTGKYLSIIDLQNDTSKKSLWRSTSSLGTNNSSITDRKEKGGTFTPSFKKSNSSNKGFSDSKKLSKSKDGSSNSKGLLSQLAVTKVLNVRYSSRRSHLNLRTRLRQS